MAFAVHRHEPPAIEVRVNFGVFAGREATHAEIKGRALYFKKLGERWFLENRNTEEPKKEP